MDIEINFFFILLSQCIWNLARQADKRGGLWWEEPYKRGTTVPVYFGVWKIQQKLRYDWLTDLTSALNKTADCPVVLITCKILYLDAMTQEPLRRKWPLSLVNCPCSKRKKSTHLIYKRIFIFKNELQHYD